MRKILIFCASFYCLCNFLPFTDDINPLSESSADLGPSSPRRNDFFTVVPEHKNLQIDMLSCHLP